MNRREGYASPEDIELSFQDQLIKIWQENSSETIEMSVADRKKMNDKVEQREAAVDNQDIFEVLTEYGIDKQKVTEDENGDFRITIENHFSSKRLPEGYGYKGGAARALLLRGLDIDPKYEPRDVDIIRFTREEPEPGLDDRLAQEYSPEDFEAASNQEGRDTVEYSGDLDEYFNSRDYTLNELYATDNEVVATRQCLLDTVRHVIRLTEYESNMFSDRIGPKMLAKTIFLYAEAIERWGDATVDHNTAYENNFVPPFYLAVHLDKAFERGAQVAQRYTRELVNREQIPADINTPEEAADYLLSVMRDKNFYYRHAPTDQFDIEEGWMEEFTDQPKFRGHGRSRGDK